MEDLKSDSQELNQLPAQTPRSLSDEQKEAVRFLDRDFNQCFQQMRYYDAQIVDICKFAFTGYLAAVGFALGLYKYGTDTAVDYTLPSASVLLLAACFGGLLLGLVVRNRVYFVLVTRYVNEHRAFFMRQKPLGFQNETTMYVNRAQPPYFSWLSSQAWLTYMLALLNASMFTVAAILVAFPHSWPLASFVVTGLAILSLQLAAAIGYMVTRERKSASRALWGRD